MSQTPAVLCVTLLAGLSFGLRFKELQDDLDEVNFLDEANFSEPLEWASDDRVSMAELFEPFSWNSDWHDNDVLAHLSASEKPLEGIQLHLSQAHHGEILAETKAPKYIFGVSTGHCGTTSLSNAMTYVADDRKKVVFDFEKVDKDLWTQWFDKKPSFEEQVNQVSKVYKPFVDARLQASGKDSYMDLGHHNLMGILQATPAVFGKDNTMFIRVRRNRLHTAFGFRPKKHDGVCNDFYRICPLTNDHMLMPKLGWGETHQRWKDLSHEQQVLWFVDEVEAQFQHLLSNNEDLSYLECNWDDDLRPCFDAVNKIVGVHVKNNRASGRHRNTRISSSLLTEETKKSLMQQDADYQKMMDFDSKTKELIKKAQFYSIESI